MIDAVKSLLQDKHWKNAETSHELKDQKVKVTITGLSQGGLVVRTPSRGKAHSGMIDNTPGYKVSCDYMLLVPRDSCMDIYLIEIKETLHRDENGIPKEAPDQIFGTVPVLQYLTSMTETHFPKEKKKIETHYVIIAKKDSEKTDKQKVKPVALPEECEYDGVSFKIFHSRREISIKEL